MNKETQKIIWISGKCGYGKTALANSMLKKYEAENKKVCKMECQEFVDNLVKTLKLHLPTDNIINYFKNYDLLVLDDVDYYLSGKEITQEAMKEVIQKITDNNKTKVILITQKRARKLNKLKFDSDYCEYIRLKIPSTNFKIKLLKKWTKKDKIVIPQNEIKEIVGKSNNLFKLKGLFLQTFFILKNK